MKQQLISVVDRLARRASRQMSLSRPRGDSFDILEIAFLQAAWDAAEIYQREFLTCPVFATDLDLLSEAISVAPTSGSCLEFGVATGRTITHLANLRPSRTFDGFDSFEGLPEAWRSHFDKGAFAQALPPVPGNVNLIKGWFNETLQAYLDKTPGPIALLHIDCDLYSSTKTVFDMARSRMVPGTVIVFDEYWNYPGWREHEYRAFEELKSSGVKAKPIGFVPGHQQAAFVLV